MMLNKEEWIEDWRINNDCDSISLSLIEVFSSFLTYLKQERKLSEKTIKKHQLSCHALGGHIVNDLFNSESPTGDKSKTGTELIVQYLSSHEGPLIFQDNENWQEEIDATCRKLFKYINL